MDIVVWAAQKTSGTSLTAVWVAVITSVTSLVVATTSLWFQRRSAREAREEERRSEAKVVLDKYRGPLLAAASDLGGRIDNIRHGGFLEFVEAGSSREHQARLTTLFRFAQYFGWREVLRTEVQLLRFERESDTQLVAALIGDVDWAFASGSLADDGRGMLWAEEQRGIGELMLVHRDDGPSTCRGYATYESEYEERFALCMDRLAEEVLSARAQSSHRLRLVQWALVGLVIQLDEEHAYMDQKWMGRALEEIKKTPGPDAPRVELRIKEDAIKVATVAQGPRRLGP